MPSTDQLRDYRRKRRPGKTPEPAGKASKGSKKGRKGPIFVIQRHQARALHYDLRLERDGALASWAVPKGMPLDPSKGGPPVFYPCWIGTPEEALAGIEEIHSAIGMGRAEFIVGGTPRIPHEDVLRSLELMGETIIPALHADRFSLAAV